MGTLFDQLVRKRYSAPDDYFEQTLDHLVSLANSRGVALADVVALYAAMERGRANDLYADNGDAWDEQIAGIGEIMQRQVNALEALPEAVALLAEKVELFADIVGHAAVLMPAKEGAA